MGGSKSTITIIDEWCADDMDNIKFDEELVDIDKVKSLIIDLLNDSRIKDYIDFTKDNLDLDVNEMYYKRSYFSNEICFLYYNILINKKPLSVFPHCVTLDHIEDKGIIRMGIQVILVNEFKDNKNNPFFVCDILKMEEYFDLSDIMKGETNGSI